MSAAAPALKQAVQYVPLVTHGPSRITRIVPVPGQPWPIHIYSPAFPRNREAPPGDQIPLWVMHHPGYAFRRLILVEGVEIYRATGRTNTGFPVPSGIGGGVVAAVWTDREFDVWTSDPWNWDDGGLPPWIDLPETFTRADLFQQVLRHYTKGGR